MTTFQRTDKYSKKTLSVIIPCFNEQAGLEQLDSRLKEFENTFAEPHELIFVDDGSSDSTYKKLTDFYRPGIDKGIKIIRHHENRGVGAALRTGIANSEGDYVAAIDSDCTYEPAYLIKMLDIVRREKADVITASPYHPEGSTVDVPGYRLFLSRNLSNLYNLVSKNKLYTYTSMVRIYRREAIKNIDFKSDGFLAMAEILIKARRKGFKIIEYPATLKGRKFGVSNAKTLRMIREHISFILKMLAGKA
jgi:dolichol-phosphate mannosyltransferase